MGGRHQRHRDAHSLTAFLTGVAVPELADEAFSALIVADHPIVVERALYADSAGVFWAAGTNATGTPIP